MLDRVRGLRRELRSVVRAVRDHGRLTDSPRDRTVQWLQDLLLSPTLTNVALGGALSATGSYFFGSTPAYVVLWAWFVVAAAATVYTLGNEVVDALAAARSAMDEDPRGVE